MKTWVQFFSLSFFSHKLSKEGTKRGYTNLLLGLILAFAFLFLGMFGGDMLPFGARYNRAPDFAETVHAVLANQSDAHHIEIEINKGVLKAKKQGGEYTESLVVNTLGNEADKQVYSVGGYDVVLDTRPANTLAEIQAYCVSNDGQGLEISYEEYLTLTAVAKLNFQFQLRYTGNPLVLDDQLIHSYKQYIATLGDEQKAEAEKLQQDLTAGAITKEQYDRSIYQLYFTNYYPSIAAYEGSSKVPLLRNYYYHQYIKAGKGKYLLIFDDYLAASFQTKGGQMYSFYGYYNNMEDGVLIDRGLEEDTANKAADDFIKQAFKAMAPITAYADGMNVFSLIPLIALMPLVVALLIHSIMKLRGVNSIRTFGDVAKIVGSYIWFSAFLSAAITVVLSFIMPPRLVLALPLVIFFVALVARSIVFTVTEAKAHKKRLEQMASQTEV